MLTHETFTIKTAFNIKCFFIVLTYNLILSSPFHAATAQKAAPVRCHPTLTKIITSKVSQVIDFQTVKLENGQRIRLAGLHIPTSLNAHPSPQTSQQDALHLSQMIDFLKRSLIGKSVFYTLKNPPNRYGYHIVMLYLSSKMVDSVQEVIITKGLAVFFALRHPITCSQNLLKAEQRARQLKTGFWARKNDLLLQAKPVKKINWKTQNFHLVEGHIHTITQRRKIIYINFGSNWRTDFTIILQRNDLAGLEKKGLKLKDLEHKKVRIRGWMDYRNGPYIPLQIADNIEILE